MILEATRILEEGGGGTGILPVKAAGTGETPVAPIRPARYRLGGDLRPGLSGPARRFAVVGRYDQTVGTGRNAPATRVDRPSPATYPIALGIGSPRGTVLLMEVRMCNAILAKFVSSA